MNRTLVGLFAAAALGTGLAACGGGGDDSAPAPPVTSQVPASASVSVANFIAYLQQLVVASADTLEPVDVSAVVPPTSDTDEPLPIN